MPNKMTIIGSGIAAIAAAIEAESCGAEVTIIRGRPGATALFSGAWDVGEMRGLSDRHPYSLLSQNGEGGDPVSFLAHAVERVSARLDLRLRGSIDKGLVVMNPLGLKTTNFVAPIHWGGNFREMHEARLLIVGFRGLFTYPADQTAALLREILSKGGNRHLAEIHSTEISLKEFSGPMSSIPLARTIDREEVIVSLHDTLVRETERYKPTHIALPPVIGIRKTDHILSRLKEATGLTWFETLGFPPSLPGLRLQLSIDDFLNQREKKDGEAIGARIKNRKVTHVRIRKGDQEEELPVDRLILATGRFLGGGIIKEKAFHEPILDLPLFSEDGVVEKTFVGKLTSEKFLEDHPLFSVGVRVNQNMQPLGERGELLYENLWAAGSLIGGYNPTTGNCGMGVAVASGTLSGRLASL